MEPKELVTIGVVAVGGIAVLVFVASRQSSSTSTGVDPNAAATENNIIAANTTAQNTQSQLSLGLAGLAVQSQQLSDAESVANNQTAAGVTTSLASTSAAQTTALATTAANVTAAGYAETVALGQQATDYETTHDTNQTALLTAANNGASQVQLAKIAANSTYTSALLDTTAKIQSNLSQAQTAQYSSYVTGNTALAGDAATTTQVGLQTAATQAIAQILGTTQVNVAGINAQSASDIATTNAGAAEAVSNNQTTVDVNAADRAASASKSNGFWGALSSIAGSVSKIFAPSLTSASTNGDGGGGSYTGGTGPTPYVGDTGSYTSANGYNY